MKTRDEQIEDAANERYPKIHPAWAGTENEAFINGAEWADSHPVPLTIPEWEIEKASLVGKEEGLGFRCGVNFSLRYLNAQRGGGGVG